MRKLFVVILLVVCGATTVEAQTLHNPAADQRLVTRSRVVAPRPANQQSVFAGRQLRSWIPQCPTYTAAPVRPARIQKARLEVTEDYGVSEDSGPAPESQEDLMKEAAAAKEKEKKAEKVSEKKTVHIENVDRVIILKEKITGGRDWSKLFTTTNKRWYVRVCPLILAIFFLTFGLIISKVAGGNRIWFALGTVVLTAAVLMWTFWGWW